MTDKIHIFENFDAQDWSDKDFTGHKFIECQINHVKIGPETKLYGTEFHLCNCTYWEAEGVTFDHFSALASHFENSNFKRTTWKKSRLHNCFFTWAQFHGADLWDCSGEGSEFYLSHINYSKVINPFDRDMIGEIIRSSSDGDVEIMMVAGLVKSNKYLCWREFKQFAKLPQWEKVSEIIYSVLNKHPSVNLALAASTMKEE